MPRDYLLLAGGRVVTPHGVLSPGWIRLAGDLIDAVGTGDPREPELPAVDLRGQWVLPGFVDLHVHGGGGASFTEGTSDEARQAAEFHRSQGSTSMLASLVTAPVAELEARAAMLAGLADEGLIAGLHLEGPFLSPARRGAQDARHMIAPDVAVFERLRAAARGHLRVITVAPELPGATRGDRGGDASRRDRRRRAHRRHCRRHHGRRRRRRDARDPLVQRHAAAASPRAGRRRCPARPGRGHLRGDRRRRAPARHRDPPGRPRRGPRPAGPGQRRHGGRRDAGRQLSARLDAGDAWPGEWPGCGKTPVERARSPVPPPPWPAWSGTRSPRACPSPMWPPPRAPPRLACWASATVPGP